MQPLNETMTSRLKLAHLMIKAAPVNNRHLPTIRRKIERSYAVRLTTEHRNTVAAGCFRNVNKSIAYCSRVRARWIDSQLKSTQR